MVFNVLIVEDDPMVSMINQRYVEKVAGFQIEATAENVAAAKTLLTEHSFDLVLIDIHLKNESGVDLVKWIRTEDIAVDFIIISAENEKKTVQLALDFGSVDYILKPFKFERFKQSLSQYKQKMTWLNTKEVINQADMDKLYGQDKLHHSLADSPLEKGISKKTLKHILNIINVIDQPFSIDEVTAQSGISHVTVRKYIHYLEAEAILKTEVEYGDIGRPTTFYELR